MRTINPSECDLMQKHAMIDDVLLEDEMSPGFPTHLSELQHV